MMCGHESKIARPWEDPRVGPPLAPRNANKPAPFPAYSNTSAGIGGLRKKKMDIP
jgi:hypothetical protein